MKVFVIDSHAIYRRGLVASLELLDRVESVEEAADAGSARDTTALAQADLVIVDVSMPGGQELLAAAIDGGAHVIACTSDCGEASMIDAVEAGVVGYLRKDTLTHDVLQAAIQAAQGGASVVSAEVLAAMLRGTPVDAGDDDARGPARVAGQLLTDREQRVLSLIAEGHPTREVATQLCYSERTVKNVMHDVVTKLNVRSRSQAVAHAVRDGLI